MNKRSHWGLPLLVLGGPILTMLLLSASALLPTNWVIPGDRLWSHTVSMLRTKGMLEPDETILYFYSTDWLSYRANGQFISDCCVVAYQQDPQDGRLYMAYAYYEDIQDITVAWSDAYFAATVVTVDAVGARTFKLWLSSQFGGDRRFVDTLTRRWRATQNQPGPYAI